MVCTCFSTSYVCVCNSEFCGEKNHDVDMPLEAVPQDSVCDYLLESAEVEEEEEGKGKGEGEGSEKSDEKAEARSRKGVGRSSLVIFAVDISGSMSTTTTVPDLQGQQFQHHTRSLTYCACPCSQRSGVQPLVAVEEEVDLAISHVSMPSRRQCVVIWRTWPSLNLRTKWL